jgi:excisionase family DNA binding protein
MGTLSGRGEPAGEAQALLLARTIDASGSLLLRGAELAELAELPFVDGMGAVLAVTLHGDGGRVTGMLAVAAADGEALATVDVGFAQAIANVVGTATARRHAERELGRPSLHDPAPGATAPPLPPEPTLSLGQVAQVLGISTTTARRWADAGRLRTTRTAGGHRRFVASEVRRLLTARGRPAIAQTEPPRRPLPALAALVDTHGAALADLSWRALYGELRAGYFLEPEGVAAGECWLSALSSAVLTGNYAMLHEATSALVRAAERGGASLLERHLAIERFGETAVRALARRSSPREEIIDARRLFACLAQRQLAEAG